MNGVDYDAIDAVDPDEWLRRAIMKLTSAPDSLMERDALEALRQRLVGYGWEDLP